jgi:hypothetical protein
MTCQLSVRPNNTCSLLLSAFLFVLVYREASASVREKELARDATVIAQSDEPKRRPSTEDAARTACKSEDADHYSEAAHTKLMEALAYDRGPGGMSRVEMERKIQSLIDGFSYNEVKALLKACTPQFRQGYLNANNGLLDMQLKRSRILMYEEIDQKRFYRLVVLLTGLP